MLFLYILTPKYAFFNLFFAKFKIYIDFVNKIVYNVKDWRIA